MHELIDDTLELSAIESGKVKVRAEQVELHPIVDEVISSLANKAAEQSVNCLEQCGSGSDWFMLMRAGWNRC